MSNSLSSRAVDHFVPANVSSDIIMVIGRVLIAAIFLLSGLSKLAIPGHTVGYIGGMLLHPLGEVRHAHQARLH